MNIVTTYFRVKRLPGSLFIGEQSLKHQDARQREYMECLSRNIAHPGVQSVTLLVEGAESYQHFMDDFLRPLQTSGGTLPVPRNSNNNNNNNNNNSALLPVVTSNHLRKIVPILFSPAAPSTASDAAGSPGIITYADLFRMANQMLPGRLAMICNADVYLSQTNFCVDKVAQLFDKYAESHNNNNNNNKDGCQSLALALTRYESENRGDAPLIAEYRGSHDAFVLRAPVSDAFIRNVGHPQNCYQAENVVIHELQACGHTVLNPCIDLHLIHKHAADVRQWLLSTDPARYGRAHPISLQQAFTHCS